MIARQYRFHGYNALRFVYRQGRTTRTPYCLLRFAPNPRRDHCRVAVVVGKKVHKSAVVRNRIRRRLYAAVQGSLASLPAYDLVFTVVTETVATIPEKDINNIIIQLLQTIPHSHVAVDNSAE